MGAPKNMMDQTIIEILFNRNEIYSFFKRMVADEKWVTYDIVWKQCRSNEHSKAAQTVAKSGQAAIKFLLCIW